MMLSELQVLENVWDDLLEKQSQDC